MQLLAESLRENQSLRILDVSFNHFKDEGASSIAKMVQQQVKKNSTSPSSGAITELYIQGNKISALGLIPLFNALTPKQNKNSTYL